MTTQQDREELIRIGMNVGMTLMPRFKDTTLFAFTGDALVNFAAALLAEDGRAGGEVVALRQENELLRTALRFYANGDHYHLDASEEFDTVSGEPQNWLCSGLEDSETMVENGEVARHTLMGHVLGWEDAEEDHTPQPIAGEAPFSAAALQTAYNTRPQPAQVAQPLTIETAEFLAASYDARIINGEWVFPNAARLCGFARACIRHGIGKDQP